MYALARCAPEGITAADHARILTIRFLCALGFITRRLAHMLDSLVRVSRRVGLWSLPVLRTFPHPFRGQLADSQSSLHSAWFHVLFTFFSKFFSSFPHGTCSLSVSREYLGLDGIYHLFCAAVPSNTTLYTLRLQRCKPRLTGLVPSMARHLNLVRRSAAQLRVKTTIPQRGFRDWPIPISVALTMGILVSFFSSA